MLGRVVVVCLFFLSVAGERASSARAQRHQWGSTPLRFTHSVQKPMGNTSLVNVMDYGANGDGKTDNTVAFQRALDDVGGQKGGIVWVPEGTFAFASSIKIPLAVTLEGVFRSVPSHNVGQHGTPPSDGTVLMPSGGHGNENGAPFISMTVDSVLRGVTIYYPGQNPEAAPVPYPWTISMKGNNPAVMDVELLNSYNGISAVSAHRHYIARVQGQPANIGIFVDETYDIGRIEDVHWNPWYSGDARYMEHQLTLGVAFRFGRSDWEYVLNTFAFGYAVGYHFIETPTGEMNGNFLGLGADLATNCSVQVDAAQPMGLAITNGEFTAFYTKAWCPSCTFDSAQVCVNPSNKGAVRFVNSAFWGPADQIAKIHGQGTVGFNACTFVQWDLVHKDGRAAITATEGSLIVQGCEFQMKGTQIEIGAGVNRAVITGNIISGKLDVDNKSAGKIIIANNADEE